MNPYPNMTVTIEHGYQKFEKRIGPWQVLTISFIIGLAPVAVYTALLMSRTGRTNDDQGWEESYYELSMFGYLTGKVLYIYMYIYIYIYIYWYIYI